MSDVYIPGVKSRFNSEKLIEDLMKIERLPKERTEKNIETLESQKSWWQELGKRITSLRDSARMLFSYQNPFNERVAISSDESVIMASASREAGEQNLGFTVKQLAEADRFLSLPIDEKVKIEAGTYDFTVGKDNISLDFRGGTLREFIDALNRRGRDRISASLITVQPGSKSLLLESKMTGAQNRIGFSGSAADLAVTLGIAERVNDTRSDITISQNTVKEKMLGNNQPQTAVTVQDGVATIPSLAAASVAFGLSVEPDSPLVLQFETATKVEAAESLSLPQPPPGPSIPSSGSVTYGGVTVQNTPSQVPLPEWTPPPLQERTDTLAVLSLTFSDGTRTELPAITDTEDFSVRQYKLADFAAGKTITALNIENANTHREIALRGALVFDSTAVGEGLKPLNPVSTAQDALLSMEGIPMSRPSNTVDDIIPGVTVTLRGVSDRQARLDVQPDREGIKNAIFSLVGNYNRLMAELNVLTRTDGAIINELTYLEEEEITEMRKRLGAFSGDSTLNQFRAGMLRAVSSSYPTDEERDMAMLTQIGISTNTRSSDGAGYSPSRLRGYLEIDEKKFDTAVEQHLPAIRQLFGSDLSGDLLVDSGVAFNLDNLSKPFVEIGGIIALKSGTIDSRVAQDKRRIDTMDRQLAAKELELKVQYSRMESAYARMEQMSSSLDNFSRRNSGSR